MKISEFNKILRELDSLTTTQRKKLLNAIDASEGSFQTQEAIENSVADAPVCPHCDSEKIHRWGSAHGMQRYRCKSCGKTFNVLTGTPLARLRHKKRWLKYTDTLKDGLSIRKAAEECEVHYTTTFRWRHRFLTYPAWHMAKSVAGIVETDETFFLESFKGKRILPRPPRKRGGKATKRGLSREQIPVLTIRDRHGNTIDQVISGIGAKQIMPVLVPAMEPDAILCSDGARAYKVIAARTGIEHHAVKAVPGQRTNGAYHIQNVNAYHSRLKGWMKRFKGVSTEYLQNYLGWRRMLETYKGGPDHKTWIQMAIRDE